jgi:nucleotide-binding universal stress UspA family protein
MDSGESGTLEVAVVRPHFKTCAGTDHRRAAGWRASCDAFVATRDFAMRSTTTMTATRRILCPTDFSSQADRALDYAIELAHSLGATLWLVHVLEPPALLYSADIASAALIDEAIKVQRETTERDMRRARERCEAAHVPVETQIECGLPRDVLVGLSKHADLIVMGTRGRTGLRHLVLGSVAERVVRMAKCPVTVVPDGHEVEEAAAPAS